MEIALTMRKNLSPEAIFRRPPLRDLVNRNPRGLFPAHVTWPQICTRVRPGELLIPTYNDHNGNRIIKKGVGIIQIPAAERYTAHAFRRGAVDGLMETGPQ